ncbi:hypothetical protein MAXJ12_30897 [Mesorhizobium alhagi CCNWXJ12-2]|uniref:Uncharacterized protein n=1 Tax=Mesorhizobium alhagi CCNWXJ12-2 TaxID=1107882 RepID=H0I142_9HYPH|nr:hypothetical protein MAXJ12_30897 [Mesorhizobium alhagi CCNWXJ12-2]
MSHGGSRRNDRTAAELRLPTRQVYNSLCAIASKRARGKTAQWILDGDWMNCAGYVGTTRLGNILGAMGVSFAIRPTIVSACMRSLGPLEPGRSMSWARVLSF